MSWFSNLFTRRVVLVAPEVEEVQRALDEKEEALGEATILLERYEETITKERDKLDSLREEVAVLQDELARLKNEPTYQALLDIVDAQTTANRAMKEVVQKYAKQL